jgi:hypothetical protein
MLQFAIIFAWLIALGLAAYLVTQAIRRRLLGRQRRRSEFRKLREFRRHHRFDQKAERWVRKVDGTKVIDEVAEDRRFRLIFFGSILFVLWEGYWLSEVSQRFSESTRPFQLPYVLLFFILVVLPFAVYLFFRRRLRRSAQSLPTEVRVIR